MLANQPVGNENLIIGVRTITLREIRQNDTSGMKSDHFAYQVKDKAGVQQQSTWLPSTRESW